MALAYHSSIFSGTVSMGMIRFIRVEGIPAEKYPMSTFWSEIVANATWFWNAEMYSMRDELNEHLVSLSSGWL